jgi:hypothetical protein
LGWGAPVDLGQYAVQDVVLNIDGESAWVMEIIGTSASMVDWLKSQRSENHSSTTIGDVVPIEDANRYCLRILESKRRLRSGSRNTH